MRQGHLSQLDIQCLVLKHNPQVFETYNDEIEYLISHEQRNKFITNLSLDLKGNTLVLYSRVEAHGAVLYEKINSNKGENRKVFYNGGIVLKKRTSKNGKRKRILSSSSYGTFYRHQY